MNKKFELLLDDTIETFGRKLFRIRSKVAFGSVEVGEKGGYIEKEGNLSQSGNAWVYGNARVYGNAEVSGDARVSGNARVYGDAEVYGNAWDSGNAEVSGDARVTSKKDYIVFKNSWSSFRWFTYTKSNKMWNVGCFSGTGQELIEKAYKDNEKSGKSYEAYVNLVLELEKLDD